jgi:hypothetical protein
MPAHVKPPVSPILVSLMWLLIGTPILLTWIPFNIIVGLLRGLRKYRVWLHELKHQLSEFGGTLHSASINQFCYTKDGWLAGSASESVSSCFGKNYVLGTLTGFGKVWYKTMDLMDKNHSLDAIEFEEGIDLNGTSFADLCLKRGIKLSKYVTK